MLRRQARLRREYLFKKSAKVTNNKLLKNKEQVQESFASNKALAGSLKKNALKLKNSKIDCVPEQNEIDDEYRFEGCEDPKIMITTSHDPSSRLKMFVKELRLIFPNAQRMNRGNYDLGQLMHACRANNVTDFIIIHEHRGIPDNLVISHLPYGPTAYFNISDVTMRHDIPDIGPMSEQKPHLIFHNFKTKLGERTMKILKNLFPVPKEDSKRVMTFANHDDYIAFRHHTYEYVEKKLEIKEAGPRFQLKLYEIKLGPLDEIQAAETEWSLRPYMNTTGKRRFLSDEDGWNNTHDTT